MKRILLLITIAILLLAGCSRIEEQQDLIPSLDPIAVELNISPEQIETSSVVTFTATVTQAGKKVDDASEVVFEVWKKGDEEHEMIPAHHQGEGQYVIEKQFDQDGIYTVISHVTARNMHSMPKKEFVVGSGDTTTADEHQGETAESSEGDHHEHSDLEIGFQVTDVIEVEKETVLTATINMDHHTPLLGADVQFEIWQDGDEKHNYVRATETDGSYQAKTTFSSQGNYNVRIHVVKNELHDHVEKIVEVK